MCEEFKFLNELLDANNGDIDDYKDWTMLYDNTWIKTAGVDIDGFPTYHFIIDNNIPDKSKFFYEYYFIDFSDYTLYNMEQAISIHYNSIDDLISRGNDLFTRLAECLVKSAYANVEYSSECFNSENILKEAIEYFKTRVDDKEEIWKQTL